ncbi:MAG: serine hydrolase domain-containing protein [Nocardioides sp.]
MQIHGTVDPRFETVRDSLAEVVAASSGTGSALAVWHDGAWVVDLWGGYADAARTRPWARDSVVMPYSVTKPFAAVCALVLADRGRLRLDEPMSTYWPELRAGAFTVRQVLSHACGVVVLDEPAPTEALYDWHRMCTLLAAQEPLWAPGEGIGEAALFYGHLVGEVVRRVDGRSLGTFLREEVCAPLGLDFQVGLPAADLDRVVDLTGFDDEFRRRGGEGDRLMLRALGNPPGALDPAVVNSEAWRQAEIPAVNGHGTARAVAGLFQALATGELLSPEMTAELTTVTSEGTDRVVGAPVAWGLGVSVDPDDGWGMGGTGGSFGWWSESGRYALGFVTGDIAGHDRGERLENAVRNVLGLAPV